MKRAWQVTNIVSVLFALAANYIVGARVLDLPGINTISTTYATPLTPASYAFSIWSLIYILLLVFAVYQARDIMKPRSENDLPGKIGPYFAIANICNGLWTYVFVKEYIGLSVLILLTLTASLFVLLFRLRIATYNASRTETACIWWPLLIYTGWVTVAAVVNVASWAYSQNILITPLISSVILIGLMAALILVLLTRHVRELLLASAWGIFAIGIQQVQDSGDQGLAIVAFTVSGVLLLAVTLHFIVHRHHNPFFHHRPFRGY